MLNRTGVGTGVTGTVGQAILSSAAQREQFIAVNAQAVVDTFVNEFSGQPITEFERSEFWRAFGEAQVPWEIRAEIMGRVMSYVATGHYGGNPNSVDGWDYNATTNRWTRVVSGVEPETYEVVVADDIVAARLNEVRGIRLAHDGFGASAPDNWNLNGSIPDIVAILLADTDESYSNIASNTLSDSLSGLAAITGGFDGTPLENFVASAFWPNGGIEWDWSSVSIEDVTFAVPFATPGNSYTPVPGIVVSGNGGQFIGSFAQTNDGRPAISVTDTINGTTQTYMQTAPGIAGVVLDNGSYSGSFAVAPGSQTGSAGVFIDPAAGIGQFENFVIRDNATGETVGDGVIVGGDGVDQQGGDLGNDTIVSRTRDATTGAWQTTVVTAQQAALNQIDFNLQNYELAGSEIGQIFGSSLGQALAGDNIFAQVASSTVLGTLLQNVGETWGRSVSTGESLLDSANSAFTDFDQELGQNFQQQALGAVSGFLLGELAESLGFDGAEFGDQLLRASAGSLASTVMNNALAISQGSTTVDLFTGIDGNLATGIGSFVGGYIAREIVAPETLRMRAANDDAPWPVWCAVA